MIGGSGAALILAIVAAIGIVAGMYSVNRKAASKLALLAQRAEPSGPRVG